MAINIQNIIDQITAKSAAADSTDTADYLLTLSKAVLAMNNATGVIEYRAKSQLPTVDSSILGNFAYIAAGYDIDSVYADSYAGFYYAARIGSNDSGWDRIRTGVDSDAENAGASYSFQGSISGYASGGNLPNYTDTIQKYSYVSDANATDVGNLLAVLRFGSGQSSSEYGYVSGGTDPSQSPIISSRIQKFSFSIDGNATDVGDLTVARQGTSGQSNETYGYASAGQIPSSPTSNIIDKFPFSVDTNATDVGDLTIVNSYVTGQSSADNGYRSGGSPYTNVIDKFPFASDANATDVGDLTRLSAYHGGQSSAENGYTSGGHPPFTNIIDKFPFATDANATDVGNLTGGGYGAAGTSSIVSGYTQGGRTPAITNVIDKFSFATDGNATDVGDLLAAVMHTAGQQV